MKSIIGALNAATRAEFRALGGPGARYATAQKDMALALVDQHGIRGVVRVLRLNRRTLQRWCRKSGKTVPDCPPWLKGWAEQRRKRLETRGY